ncbi:MAG: biopolymer transporter ExbD [Elusimicrobia bacterium]|nr:biopolymer transporter ExbD [Elusimicrobiota bacterium]
MKFKRRHHRLIERLDPTPMTDVIFNLVIFFMIGASFGLPQAIRVKLPQAATSEPHPEKQWVLTITKDNQFYLNDKKIYLATLPQELKAKFSTRKDNALIIKADRAVLHGMVVQVMDMAKKSGVEKLAIATEPEKP